ncbi:HAD-like protein [Aspergillus saccharolyticus JOP 1030-1]|uniref:HAD-like protein n=1 Tax=Aspergillus saccharolyticus JOP 1030-1 TaxID=1450539 RepID=A0A318ZKI3_9EURO|nr:HAD-like protein [Aspergillus saccharolyticus JOP 1030-1]PYH48101.1 HAD-like protein [Aspergillus saccharolyticus JOP 1030-1]
MTVTNGLKSNKTTILVDLGGIFVHPPLNHKLTTAGSTISLGRVLSSSIWMDYEVGKLEEDDCFQQVSVLFGFHEKDFRAMVSDLRETLTYDKHMLAVFRNLKTENPGVEIVLVSNISEPEYRALRRRWDSSFWETFDHIFTSWELGVKKPSLRFYQHVLRATRASPHKTLFIDDQPENVLAAMSLGMRGIVGTDDLPRKLKNFVGNPVERGLAFLRQNAGRLFTTTSAGDTIDENYAQLLLLEATGDESLVDLKRPPRLWNFFSGKPKYTSHIYPDDMDSTALALTVLDYEPELAHSILDEMLNYVNEDGLIQVYTDRFRPRVDAVIALSVLVAFHKYDRGYELPQMLDWVYNILLHRAYMHGTRYYQSPEWVLYYAARLLRYSKDPSLRNRMEGLLRARVAERVGAEGDAFCLGMRLLACNFLGIENHPDKERLASMQQEDGGWEASMMYLFPTDKKVVGNRGTTSALAVKALQGGL